MKEMFLLTLLMQLGSLPGALAGTWAAEVYGRRRAITALCVGAAACTALHGLANGQLQLAISGFFVVVFLYALVAITFAVYVPEMFPTSVRMTGCSISNSCGRLANIFAPQGVAWLLVHTGPAWVYLGLAAVFILQGAVVWIAGEDMTGQSLEEIERHAIRQ
jgi:putative MFS transporter